MRKPTMWFPSMSDINQAACADPENFLRGVQIPRRGLTENFNMANINNLAIPGGGDTDPLSPPLDPPMKLYSHRRTLEAGKFGF